MQSRHDINSVARHVQSFVAPLKEEVARVLVGQTEVLDSTVIALLCEGHILLEGVPGLAKTLLCKTVADCIDAQFQRIQFTPDLLPSDLIGSMVYRQDIGSFDVKKGPIFANFVLADEINRAPAKVQSALLEAMQEQQITIGECSHLLPRPFLVMATQNPVDQEGTYRLPEAQVDRFMMKVLVNYPTQSEERDILDRMVHRDRVQARRITTLTALTAAQRALDEMYIDDRVRDYIVRLICATRDPKALGLDALADEIEFGASPRATIWLAKAAKAQALIDQRGYVTPDDVQFLSHRILRHRLSLTFSAQSSGVSTDEIIDELLNSIEVP